MRDLSGDCVTQRDYTLCNPRIRDKKNIATENIFINKGVIDRKKRDNCTRVTNFAVTQLPAKKNFSPLFPYIELLTIKSDVQKCKRIKFLKNFQM